MEIIKRRPIYMKRRKLLVSYRHHSSRGEWKRKAMIATLSLKQLMKYAVPVVLSLFTLQQQKKPDAKPPAAPTWCFVAATCVYWLTVGATNRSMGYQKKLLRAAALAFGILSALSLLSMFLHYPDSLLPLLIWIPLALLLTWPAACTWIRRRITTVITKIQAMVVRVRGLVSSDDQPPILPV